ncbi:MAG: T9SS type A sorting domain-containing protein [Bacteroidetes bacterium]|nr:T9SS type A sorting domain-containing protein [Bacteroidota bacterium]
MAPNPGSGKFVVSVEASRATGMQILVYNVQGKLLRTGKFIELPQGFSEVPLELSELPAGIYVSEMKLKEGSVFRKVVISKVTD